MHIALDAAFAALTEHSAPVVVAGLNGQPVKAVTFLVHRGRLEVLLSEPASTVRTGD